MRRVLVPLDGSPFAELALPVGIDIARRHGATVAVVVVHEPPPGVPATLYATAPVAAAGTGALGDSGSSRSADQHYLESIAAQSSERLGDAVVAVLLTGSPARTLITHIRESSGEERPDLVVMSTHGRGGLTRLWLGSVADAVIRHVTVPVLLVKTPGSSAMPSPPALPFRRVLIPLDGSALSEHAIEPAVEVCGTSGVQYVLVSVTEPVTAIAHTALAPQSPALTDTDAKGAAERYLRGVADRLGARGMAVRIVPAVHTNPARVLLETADETDCELIAITTHGRGGWRRAVLGSVADKVIRGAERSVLISRRQAEAEASQL